MSSIREAEEDELSGGEDRPPHSDDESQVTMMSAAAQAAALSAFLSVSNSDSGTSLCILELKKSVVKVPELASYTVHIYIYIRSIPC